MPEIWSIFRKDPVLLAERKTDRSFFLHLVYAFLSSGIAIISFFALIYSLSDMLGSIAVFTETYAQYESSLKSENALFTPGNIYSFLFIGAYGIVLSIIAISLISIHKKTFTFGLVYGSPFSWTPFFKTASALALIFVLAGTYYLFFPENMAMRPLSSADLIWFSIALVALFFQTLGEEMFFRGYLLRVWGAVIPYRIIIVGSLTALFVSVHTYNPDVQTDFWFFVIIFVITELLYYWVLFRTRSVMATWGMHFINNVFAVLVIAVVPGWKNDLAIFTYTDPVLSAGGSYLYDPWAYGMQIFAISCFILLICWKRSPFYVFAAKDYSLSNTR
ncbi:MAG: CPBP family intramembrane glutamic endopeptidase [Pseudomonadota bacterium]